MIRFHKVAKQYPNGTGTALSDITFHVGRGEFVFLTGHSGAGKSTVLKLMYAEEKPTSGDVRLAAEQLGMSRSALYRRLQQYGVRE